MRKIISVLVVLMLTASFLMAAGGSDADRAQGQVNWPTRPINILVGFAAGGNSDVNARIMAKYLSQDLGVPIVITNNATAGGTIAAAQIKDTRPDGYSILGHQQSLNIATASGVVDFDYTALDMVCIYSKASEDVLLVRGDSPWNSIQDFITASSRSPGTYRIAANTGAQSMWVAIALRNAGADMIVMSTAGAAERIPLLLGGHLDIITAQWGIAEDYIRTNQFKMLAVTSAQRDPVLPNLPTLRESGVDCSYGFYNTFFMPKGTDPAIIDRLSRAIGRIVTTNQEYANEIAAFGQTPFWLDTEASRQSWADDLRGLMAISDVLQGR